MYSLDDRPNRLCDGRTRREWLRVGGLSALGLGLGELLQAGSGAKPASAGPPDPSLVRGLEGATFGRAKNVIFLWLQGGPPQHETFDPKPDAPAEIRGPFRPIATNVPGIRFCELLPRTARMADKLAVVRSIATDDHNHDVSGYWVLTGYPYGPGSARQIKPERLALLRLDRQDAQAERAAAGADLGLGARRDAAQRQRHPGRADGRVPGQALGARAVHRRPRRRRTIAIEGLDLPAELPPAARRPPPRAARPARRLLPRRRAQRRRSTPGTASRRTPSTW